MSNLAIHDDNWSDSDSDDRVIQGTLVKCTDGHWTDRDKLAIRPGMRLLALSTLTLLQRWENQRPVETITAEPGQRLPDVDKLNATTPRGTWEIGLDGAPRPPWQKQYTLYLLDEKTAERFTFINSTAGARIAVDDLKDKVRWMRALRGAVVFPVVELSAKPMRTKFGIKQRPDFKVVEWRQLGDENHKLATTTAPAALGKPVTPPTTQELLEDEIPF